MECIQVKQEDADWLVYHQIPPSAPITVAALADQCSLGPSELEDSPTRLERTSLVERKGSEVRMLSFGEALIKNQFKYEKDLPFVIENGVIKERKR
jgi:hypothetical protein